MVERDFSKINIYAVSLLAKTFEYQPHGCRGGTMGASFSIYVVNLVAGFSDIATKKLKADLDDSWLLSDFENMNID